VSWWLPKVTLARKRFKFIALSEGKDLQPRRLPHRDGGRDLFRHQLHRITIKGATAKLREPSRSASLKAPTTIVMASKNQNPARTGEAQWFRDFFGIKRDLGSRRVIIEPRAILLGRYP